MLLSKRFGVYLFILGVSDLVIGADLPGQPFIRIPDTSIPDTPLKPLINNPLRSSSVEARESTPRVLRGLLELRQACQAGYGLCSNGGCCPLGGACCSNGGCCSAGNWCYATGCCSVTETGCEGVDCCPTGARCCQGGGCCSASENCVITSAGVKGCCPIGSTCSGTPGQCSNSAYVPCSNDDFCCAPGDTCYRDSSNTPRCSSPSQNTAPPAVTTTPAAVTTIAPPLTTRTSSPAALSSSPVPSVPAGNGVPTPPAGSTSRVISVTDSSITWVGASWVTDYNVPCNLNNTSPSKKTTADNHSLTFTCSTSTAIYINMASYNVYYDIFWNGRLTSYTPATSLPNCTYVSVAGGLTVGVSVNITIIVYGASLQSRQADTDPLWSFDMNNFVVMEPTGQTTSLTATEPANTTPAFNSGANRVEGRGIVSYVSYVLAALAWILL